MAVIIDVANAVVAALNAATFSRPVAAERRWQAEEELESLKDLKVAVIPVAVPSIEALDRSRLVREVEVDVVVQKKTADLAETDGLVALVEEIGNFLAMKRPTACPAAAWVGIASPVLCDPEHLRQYGLFTSVLALSYRVAGQDKTGA